MMMRLLHLFVTVLFIFSLATVDALVSACGSSPSDGDLFQSPLDGHCGGLSLFILGSYRWCDLNLTEMFVSLHFQDFSRVVSQKEFCSGLNLTVPAGVNKLTAALHDRKPHAGVAGACHAREQPLEVCADDELQPSLVRGAQRRRLVRLLLHVAQRRGVRR